MVKWPRAPAVFINGAPMPVPGVMASRPVDAVIVDLVDQAEDGGSKTWRANEVEAEISLRKVADAS
ncbi:MAG: hypothetical protein CML29_15780 [Rhizobiales bacterium]|nr:hypothetical protein [Hyphomicrobiales bacterium]MBA68851.1 hypothetical protein [Hyphomicrobiales bacterium]